MMREEIKDWKKETLLNGDRILIVFNIGGLFSRAKRALVSKRLSSMEKVRIDKIEYSGDNSDSMSVSLTVIDNPLPLLFLTGAITGILATVVLHATVSKVFRISPTGAIGGIATAVIASIAVLAITKRK